MGLIRCMRPLGFVDYSAKNDFLRSSAGVKREFKYRSVSRVGDKERSANLFVLFGIVMGVGLLHVIGFKCLFCDEKWKENIATPLVMEVSTIRIPSETPEAAPKQTSPTAKAKPIRKKVQIKPKLKKQALSATGMAVASTEQVLQHHSEENFNIPQFDVTQHEQEVAQQRVTYSEAYLDPAYDHNPKPEYPSIARSRGWEGKVILRVKVNEKGKVESVELEQSSSHELLDDSAVKAVKEWIFMPAMQGDKAVATSVLVPIIFTLRADNFGQ